MGDKAVKVHRFTVIVVDFEGVGRKGCRRRLNRIDYIDPIHPFVAGDGETVTVKWHDRHPLNLTNEDSNAAFDAELVRAYREGVVSNAMEPPYDSLDPGVIPVVRLFHEAGFKTCDSGDGRSKPPSDSTLPFPHVVAVCPSSRLQAEVDRAFRVLREAPGMLVDKIIGWWVEGTYSGRATSTILIRGPEDWRPDDPFSRSREKTEDDDV